MSQIARSLTDAEDGFLKGSRYLIHDRDPLFTKSFREVLKSSGVTTLKLPARWCRIVRKLNLYFLHAERVSLSLASLDPDCGKR